MNPPNTHLPPSLWQQQRKWLVLLTVVSAGIIILITIIRLLTPPRAPEGVGWNAIVPGYTTISQLADKGTIVGQRKNATGFEIDLQSDFPTIPHTVEADQNGVVRFMRIPQRHNEEDTIYKVIEQYGSPDLLKYENELGDTVRVSVFLSKGEAFVWHNANGAIEERWYFEPLSAERFLTLWGENLSDTPEQPERLLPF